MSTWIQRYKAGEHLEVWTEIDSLSDALQTPADRKAAAAVVNETMSRAQQNVSVLFAELLNLGYRFQGAPEPTEPDFPLELRLDHALAYVQARGGKKEKANPWSHPALAWVEDEEIELPARFRNGRPSRANYRPPSARLEALLEEKERLSGEPLTLAIRGWYAKVGAVDLAGKHPILNPNGSVAALRVTPDVIPTASRFVEALRHAFQWAGLPGWANLPNPPQRELDFLRAKLLPL